MNDNSRLPIFLLVILIGLVFVLALLFNPVTSSPPPTPAIKMINTTAANVTASDYNGFVEFIEGTGITISPNYATNEITFSAASGSGNSTVLSDLGDVQTTNPAYHSLLIFNGSQWTDKLFQLNTQSAANDFQITGINNQTGAITRNQFSVNTITCGGTDRVSSIDNLTGNVICSAGGAGATTLDGLTDVTITSPGYGDILQFSAGAVNQWIDKLFMVNTQTAANDFQITGINNQTGAITRNQFSVNTQDAGYLNRIKSIDNVTGNITFDTIDFIDTTDCGYGSRFQKVDNITGVVTCDTIDFIDTTTCGGTDKVSAINNITGVVTCTTDSTGAGAGGIPLPPKKWGQLIPRTAALDTIGLVSQCAILGTATFVYDTTDNSNAILSTTAVTDGINGGIHCTATNLNSFRGDQNAYLYARWEENKITTNRIFIGFSSSSTHLPNNADTIVDSIDAAGLCIRTSDTVYQFCSNDGTGAGVYASLTTSEDTGVHFFEVYTIDAGVTWCGKLDGGTAVCSSTAADIPTTTDRLYAMSTGETDGGATAILWTQYQFYIQSDK